MTQNLSNIFGDQYANMWWVCKDFLYKCTETCKIIFFYTHQLTCTCYRPPM